ncbi:MAG: TrkH family potassium uptake protein [Deltaproteobacteria bacterium]|nr:TrkH family potassium uptake protein [Deltaproteobacteria bacterium]
MIFRSRILKLHPATLVLSSFLLAITVGALLLKIPISTHPGHIPWVDALFTATSAVCVTGLIVVDTGSYFTPFGQGVILALIQMGGLGVMTIAVLLFKWIGRSISFRQRMAMQDLFAHTPREDILGLVKGVVVLTITAEAIGALLLTIHWSREFPFLRALYTAIFHSVSAFCNAGFSIFPDSMMQYSDDLLLNMTMCGLIIGGGIGFPVLHDLRSWIKFRKHQRQRLSIQTKTVLLTTLILIVSGALMFAFLERQPLRDAPSFSHHILTPIFQSITCRTAGFNTVDISRLKEATLAMMIFLMFFGASPGSCGGGVKTTTLALITVFMVSRIRRRRRVNIFKKSIPAETVTRSVSLILVSIGIIALILFLILVGDAVSGRDDPAQAGFFLACFFETVSAFGTVGLSMGVTPHLSTWGKCLIVLMMIIGRVGVLTFSYIVLRTGIANGIEHAEENMMIG